MNLAKYSLDNTKVIYFFLAVLLIGGVFSFGKLGKKEDALCHQIGRHHDALSWCRACRSGTADHRTHLPRDTKHERSIQNQVRIHVWHFQNHIRDCSLRYPPLPSLRNGMNCDARYLTYSHSYPAALRYRRFRTTSAMCSVFITD